MTGELQNLAGAACTEAECASGSLVEGVACAEIELTPERLSCSRCLRYWPDWRGIRGFPLESQQSGNPASAELVEGMFDMAWSERVAAVVEAVSDRSARLP